MKRYFYILIAGALLAAGCSSSPGTDSISSHRAVIGAQLSSCTSQCHNASSSVSPDPIMTNSTGTYGKHMRHAQEIGIPCEECHTGYVNNPSHMNGTLDTSNQAVLLVYFDATNPAGAWISDTGPSTGSCTSLNCHGTDTLDWYGTNTWNAPACSTCHQAALGTRRQVMGAGGDFASNPTLSSHHVAGGSDPTELQCRVCHDQTHHMAGTVWLFNPDTAAPLAYDPANTAGLEPFCLNCHDTGGAGATFASGGTPTNPFNDGSIIGQGIYRAGTTIKDNWNKTYGHARNGLTCLGNGNPGTGCHRNGHGSSNVQILVRNMTLPQPDRYKANDFQLCFSCHDALPSSAVSKEIVFGVKMRGSYDGTYGPFRSSTPGNVTFDNTANSISRASGDFIADEFIVGNVIETDAVDAANQGPFLISSMTATILVVTTTAGGDPSLIDKTDVNVSVMTESPPYYISAIATRFRDKSELFTGKLYDDNWTWWGPSKANLHWFHIGMLTWNWRGTVFSGISCTACHAVHGTSVSWGMTHEKMNYQRITTADSDVYGLLGAQFPPYAMNEFPLNCTMSCHEASSWGATYNWIEPPDE